MDEKKTSSTHLRNWQESRTYLALSAKLKEELKESPPDEGEIFSILDLFLFSLESEENTQLGTLGLQTSTALLNTFCELDQHFGRSWLRSWHLFWEGPRILDKIIKHCVAIRNNLGLCSKMMSNFKLSQLVHFVEESGGTYATPTIKKWLQARSLNITAEAWQKIKNS